MGAKLGVMTPQEEKVAGIVEGVNKLSKEGGGALDALKDHFSVVTVDNFLKIALVISCLLLARIIWRATGGIRKASWVKGEAEVVSGKTRRKHYILTVSDEPREPQQIKVNYPVGVGEKVPIVRSPRGVMSADPAWFAFPRVSLFKELFKGVLGLFVYLWIISFVWTVLGIVLAFTQ